MNEINMVSKAQQNKELEAKILELRKKEYTGNEIAAQLHIEQRRVARTIDILISKGLLGEEYKNLKKKETLQRKQQALNLIREGKTVKEIAETLGVVQDTIYVYIKEFIKNGEMEKEDLKKNLDLELENKVLELRKKEYSKQQIMEKLGIGQKTVVDIIQRLADEGKLPGTMLPVSQDKIAKKEQMKSDVQKLIGGGYTVAETARIIRVSESTVYNYIKELINEGKIDEREIFLKKQARLNELEQTIIELLRAGNNRKQIAKELNISYNELNPIINRLIVENKVGPVKVKGNNNSKSAENKLKNREGSNQVENMARFSEEALELIENKRLITECKSKMSIFEKEIKDGRISGIARRQYAKYCQQIVECGEKLTKEEVEFLADTVAYGEGKFNTQDLAFTCNEYAKLGDYISAQRLCATCTELYGENEMISKIKVMLKEAKNKQIAYNLIKQGKSDFEIMNASNLRQVDIIRMRKEYIGSKELKPNAAEVER